MSELAYLKIAENVDAGPLTAPKADGGFSKAFIKFLKLLYTPEEAELVQHLKMGARSMLSADHLARVTGKSAAEVTDVLEPLARQGSIIGFGGNYGLPLMPLLLNHHQFTKELGPDDIEAAQLYQQFFIKEGFYKYYESSEKGTQIFRVIPVQRAVEPGQRILETEEAHKIIDAVGNLSLVPCPCRTRTEKLGVRECKNNTPVGFCIMTETSALYFQSIGVGRKVTAEEAKRYFDEMQDLGLVGTTENFEEAGHGVICLCCLCCQCCCSQLRGRTRWDNPRAVAPSNFIAESSEDCIMCGHCVDRCFFGAIALDEDQEKSVVDAEKCMGCGVCTITCAQEALWLKRVEREKPFRTAGKLFKTITAENTEVRGRPKAVQP
jgi:Pyruvate/2-oxoacid:ferredoxin oxidoreductase delta subunit